MDVFVTISYDMAHISNLLREAVAKEEIESFRDHKKKHEKVVNELILLFRELF